MRSKMTSLTIFLAALPILLPLYNPSLELGGMGMLLGFWGLYISPVIIFGYLGYLWLAKPDRPST
ncbi:MAG: hypothetical protein K9I85_14500 [Saprospiraceae bacterium]|nr:hypothetical protein [Saprospiraceae bacterium]